MSILDKLSLDDLYKRKITKSVLDRIIVKEDFSKISNNYCTAVCTMKCKSPQSVNLLSTPVDIVILQDYAAIGDKWKSAERVEKSYKSIIDYMMTQALGLNKKKLTYRVVNLLKCSADTEKTKTGKKISQKTILKCSPYTLKEIIDSKPKIIISTTTDCTKALGLLDKSNTKNFGEAQVSPLTDIPTILTVHPRVTTMIRQNATGALWGYDFYDVILQCFKNAVDIASGDLVLKDKKTAIAEAAERVIIPTNIDEIKYWCKFLSAASTDTVISWDLETSTLDPWDANARILTCQFGFRDKKTGGVIAIVFVLWHKDNDKYSPNDAWSYIWPLIGDLASTPSEFVKYASPPFQGDWVTTSPKKIGHNGKFDIQYTAVTTGVRATNYTLDTMLIEHDINSGIQGTYGLKMAVWLYLMQTGLGGYEDELGLDDPEETDEEEDSDEQD